VEIGVEKGPTCDDGNLTIDLMTDDDGSHLTIN